jgi:hypothetical protein
MALEEDAPPLKRRRLEPLLLDSLGIEELRLYIDELKTEIVGSRPISGARTAIAARRTHSSSVPERKRGPPERSPQSIDSILRR